MTVTRRNLLTNATVRSDYARGVNLLKAEFTGPTTTNLGIPGPSQQVSTYDLFVVWHHTAMMTLTPPTQADRNAAHRGPIFCPWHRFMLLQLELNLQRVLNDATFGLPYWDWAADGQRPAAQQRTSPSGQRTRWEDQVILLPRARFDSIRAIPRHFESLSKPT